MIDENVGPKTGIKITPGPTSVKVTACVLQRWGRVLIAQRGPDGWQPLKWEFPGGKIEFGETPRPVSSVSYMRNWGSAYRGYIGTSSAF